VITAAAPIMGSFGSFVLNGDPTVKRSASACLAVILDATVVRCLSCRPARPAWARPTGTCPAGSARSAPASASRREVLQSLRSDPGRNPAPSPPGPGGAVVAAGRRTGETTARVHRQDLRPARAYPASPSGEPAMTPAEENNRCQATCHHQPKPSSPPPGGHGPTARPGRPPRDQPPAR
jgi:hypothetical protein